MTSEALDSRAERTVLVGILDDLKDMMKVAKEAEAKFLAKQIKRYRARLIRLQRESTKKHKHVVDSPIIPPQALYNEKLDGLI